MTENYVSLGPIIGFVGAFLLLVGCFAPIVTLPLFGTATYFGNGNVDAILVLVFCVVSIAVILLKKYLALYFTGIASLGVIIFDLYSLIRKIADLKDETPTSQQATIMAIQIQWGWAVLIIGGILLLISAYYCEKIDESLETPKSPDQ